MIQES